MNIKSILIIGFTLLSGFVLHAQVNTTNTDSIKTKSTKRHELGIHSSTLNHLAVSYKFGSEKFYGLLEVGSNFRKRDLDVLAVGAGLTFPIQDDRRWGLEGKILAYLYEDAKEDEKIDKGFSLVGFYEYDISKKFRISGGPSFSVIENATKNGFKSKSALDVFGEDKATPNKLGMFIGLQASVNFRF